MTHQPTAADLVAPPAAPRTPAAGRWVGSGAAAAPHPFYQQTITRPLRERLLADAVGVLAARLPASQARLDPVVHYRPYVRDWLEWVESFPGESYQDRWLASGADARGRQWLDPITTTTAQRNRFSRALEAVVCCGAIRPTYRFLLGVWSQRLWSTWREEHDTVMFRRVREAAAGLGRSRHRQTAPLIDLARMSIGTGKPLMDLSCQDLLDYRAAAIEAKGINMSISCATTYFCGRAAGLFADGPAEFEALLTMTPRTSAEIVAHHGIASPMMRGLLVEYLTERRPSMDYVSFSLLADRLCRLFWRDLEQHHPDIDSHRLTREQTEAWKQRLRTLPDGRTRKRPGEVFLAVRSFYLDINHWANDQPERWAQWATPSPVTRQDVRVLPRERRAETAKIHAHVRELVPVLPTLVHSTAHHRRLAATLLQTARATEPGQLFTVADHTYTRLAPVRPSHAVRLRAPDGTVCDAMFAEHEAFWSWAMIEVLRHTGIRIEELLELTHHSIRPYRQPNATIIPLLQIAPSKTDAERVIPASPELATVLAQIIARIAAADGTVATVSRHDEHERCWTEPMPYLFQYRLAGRPRTFNSGTLREYLGRAVNRAGLGEQITPHDFRRLFTTEAVNAGLPIHIAAALLGHQDLNVTLGYTAIYPTEVFQRYQQFLQRRRAERPTGEYRVPSTAEMAEFAEHFGKRRIELGTCVRPYNTPCIHEHACLRCPFQQIDPNQLPRLEEIQADITQRLHTARDNQWLGDITQLEQTLTHIDTKRDQLIQTHRSHPPLVTLTTTPL